MEYSLLLLRGLLREPRHWQGFDQRLAEALPDLTVLTPTLAGTGLRNQELSPSSIDEMVEDLRQQLEPSTQPLVIVALSMGAMIASCWAQRYPAEVAGLMLVNSSFSSLSPFWQRLNLHGMLPILLKAKQPYEKERRVLKLTSLHCQQPEQVAKLWGDYAAANPISGGNALRQILAAARFKGPSVSPCKQVRIVCGLADRLVSPCCSLSIAKAWQVPLLNHPVAGHDLSLDQPEWLIEQIEGLLKDIGLAKP